MASGKRPILMGDFETTTDPADCRVWVWALCDVERAETVFDVELGLTIDSFMARLSEKSAIVYFHNLAFDGSFILDWLFRQGFWHTTDNYPMKGQFSTLISNMGKFYSIKIKFENGMSIELRDSLKKLPMSAANVAEAFKLEVTKGFIDYDKSRPVGYRPTLEEREYVAKDVLIIAKALRQQFASGMKKLTVGSDALTEFKKITTKRVWDKMFPVLSEAIDSDIRMAYRGGFTYADKRFKGKRTRGGIVYDVNSLYPSVMYDRVLPYGEPKHFEGAPVHDPDYPLQIINITFVAKLKKHHIPCIQIRGSSHFINTEYQERITEPVTLMTTNIDLALWQEHYDLTVLSYNGGWMFRGVTGMFCEYIDKWMEVKANNEGGLRQIAKLMLNSLYGKFATNPNITPKIPVFEDNTVKLVLGPEDTRDPVYTPMGVFITAYARDLTIRAAQEHYDVFAYADTDSLHLLIDENPTTLDIHPDRLGTWKREYRFTEAFFIRAKAYVEHHEAGHFVTHIAGLPDSIAGQLTIDSIVDGACFDGKLAPKRVPGGIVLQDVGFTLNL